MAGQATVMGTSSRTPLAWAGVVAATSLAATGAVLLVLAASSPGGSRSLNTVPRSAGTPPRETFSRLAVAAAPPSWKSATIPSGGASLSYPSNWRPIPGDTGTVTVALRDRRGLYHGYLNVTPHEGAEQLPGWASFRAHRNAEEGDHHTHIVAEAEGLRIARARGSCVIDDYLSRVGAHAYRELACIVAGSHYTNVFVGATLLADWPRLGPVIERAAAALTER